MYIAKRLNFLFLLYKKSMHRNYYRLTVTLTTSGGSSAADDSDYGVGTKSYDANAPAGRRRALLRCSLRELDLPERLGQ